MDALAVSVGIGLSNPKLKFSRAVLPPLMFGIFQMLMPILGYFLSFYAKGKIGFEKYDPWIAFFLVVFIGIKMIRDQLAERKNPKDAQKSFPSFAMLTGLAIATSIDAFAAGISIAFLNREILPDAAAIGATTFALSLVGIKFGSKMGASSKFEMLGGVVLILIGIKVLMFE